MQRRNLVAMAVVAGLAVVGISLYPASKKNETKIDKILNSQALDQADKSSTDYKIYAALKGENYDRMFLANMLVHHQGAVDMANLALKNASHQKIKDLAKAIVSTQSIEITEMAAWEQKWGYLAKTGEGMNESSAMSMTNANAGMMSTLEGKTGPAFDSAFLSAMIMHHRSAVNMAATGEINAKHAELKTLTLAIVAAQSKEIREMKQWQSDWGYKSSVNSNSMPGMNH